MNCVSTKNFPTGGQTPATQEVPMRGETRGCNPHKARYDTSNSQLNITGHFEGGPFTGFWPSGPLPKCRVQALWPAGAEVSE